MQASTARRRLSDRLSGATIIPRPGQGWTRAIREALGMSTADLSRRMGVSHQAVVDAENAEEHWRIELHALSHAADALNCDLVYAFVPRVPLDDMVIERARDKVRQQLLSESPSLSADDLAARVEAAAPALVDNETLWQD